MTRSRQALEAPLPGGAVVGGFTLGIQGSCVKSLAKVAVVVVVVVVMVVEKKGFGGCSPPMLAERYRDLGFSLSIGSSICSDVCYLPLFLHKD